MKSKYIYTSFFIAILLFAGCSSTEDDDLQISELKGLTKIREFSNDTHIVEMYSESGMFQTGYNSVSLRIKNKSTDAFEENAFISWLPMMQMPDMNHSCPMSNPVKASNKQTVYEGFIIYQMTNLDGSGWSITINYSINGNDYSVSGPLIVLQNDRQNVSTFMGANSTRYIVSYVEPSEPIIGINELVLGVYKMENMMSFPKVDNVSLPLDPRMPGMGNHSSPNNTSAVYNPVDGMYHANLSLTMTGYWVLNLKLLDENGAVLKGEDITEDNTRSSLYLELEF